MRTLGVFWTPKMEQTRMDKATSQVGFSRWRYLQTNLKGKIHPFILEKSERTFFSFFIHRGVPDRTISFVLPLF